MRTINDHRGHILPTDYLIAFRENCVLPFHPETTTELSLKASIGSNLIDRSEVSHHGLQSKLPFWPDKDACPNSPVSAAEVPEIVGLDVYLPQDTIRVRDCPSLAECKCTI